MNMVVVYLCEHITVHFMCSVGTFKVWQMLEQYTCMHIQYMHK